MVPQKQHYHVTLKSYIEPPQFFVTKDIHEAQKKFAELVRLHIDMTGDTIEMESNDSVTFTSGVVVSHRVCYSTCVH